MEGASDHLQSSVFTGRRRWWSWRVFHSSDPQASSETIRARGGLESTHEGDVSAKSKEGLATEVSDVSSQRAPQVEQPCARDRKPRGRRHEDYAFGGV